MDTKTESYTQRDWLQGEDPPIKTKRQNPIIIGAYYCHQWSDHARGWCLISASVVEDEERTELFNGHICELETLRFREIWYGNLDQFNKDWYFDADVDRQMRQLAEEAKERIKNMQRRNNDSTSTDN